MKQKTINYIDKIIGFAIIFILLGMIIYYAGVTREQNEMEERFQQRHIREMQRLEMRDEINNRKPELNLPPLNPNAAPYKPEL